MDTALIAYLLAAAIRITGLPAIAVEELPPFVALPDSELRRQLCPSDSSECAGIAAYFDALRYRILYSDRLELDDPVDHSFLLHEMVHVLQHRQAGPTMYADCQALLQTERQAYRAQNVYLRGAGQLVRVGDALRFSTCAETSGG